MYRRIKRTVVGGDRAPDGGAGAPSTDEADRPDVSFDPDALDRRIDVLNELGLAPGTFVERLLEEQGGHLKQQAFTDYTDWSEPTVTRLLQEMEDDGEVVRVTVGREKIVYLPEQAPTTDVQPADDGDPARSV